MQNSDPSSRFESNDEDPSANAPHEIPSNPYDPPAFKPSPVGASQSEGLEFSGPPSGTVDQSVEHHSSGQDRSPLPPPVNGNPIALQVHDFRTQAPGLYRIIAFLWNAIGMPAVSLLVFFGASFVAIVIAAMVVHGEFHPRMLGNAEVMAKVTQSRVGFLILVLAPQLALVSTAIVLPLLSPDGFRRRLSLVRGHWPLWAWAAAAMTTPLIGWISSIVVGTLMGESENMKMMTDVFRGHGESGFLIPLALMIGATPALCEELVFRGYIQTRLNTVVGPFFGIAIASVLFAVFHWDLVHVIAVLPLGFYLGVIAWRSGSLFPAMLAHFVNNSISVFAVVMAPEQEGDLPSVKLVAFFGTALLLALASSIVTAIALWRLPMPVSQAIETHDETQDFVVSS
ncbi:type II CAAX endopeptidase family protein [Roseiconus lacunae]|uniref:type II CAAX endopeptidase family protein n=1 Tax=Roseiconus lacunae TaxID=2605694 RepID=UPI001E373E79|nr:type II CAAX endopeptidase family protein [Roseiconus lacunae]MCD0460424.1 CPBP family glutamic-type intramembrane protease [Roseiconus lacunae]